MGIVHTKSRQVDKSRFNSNFNSNFKLRFKGDIPELLDEHQSLLVVASTTGVSHSMDAIHN